MTDELGITDEETNLTKKSEFPTKEEMKPHLIAAVKTVASWKNIQTDRLKSQISVCMSIMDGISKGYKKFIVKADTGFGKSILGMMAGEMFQNFSDAGLIDNGDGSYILTPNLMLQDQYQTDIDKFDLHKQFAQLKGTGNYPCLSDVTKTFSSRPCFKISVSKLKDKMECGASCPYVLAREKAMLSRTTVMNYNYWLTSMNFTFENLQEFAPFAPRGLSIFDEAHTIAPIVNDMFKTELDLKTLAYEMGSMFSFVSQMYGGSLFFDDAIKEDEIEKINDTIERVMKQHTTFINYANMAIKNGGLSLYQNVDTELKSLETNLMRIEKMYSSLMARTFPKDESDQPLSDEQIDIKNHAEEIQAVLVRLTMVKKMFEIVGLGTMVLDTEKREVKSKSLNQMVEKEYFIIRCVKDDELVRRHAMKYTNYSILMSATMGDSPKELAQFSMDNGLDKPFIVTTESDFDYSNSPIIMTTPTLKMSYKHKEENMPKMLERIKTIVHQYPKECGLIHTGNYAFQKILSEYVQALGISERFLFCYNAKQKRQNIELIKWELEQCGWTNRILVGASLLEGIDLKDDLCRFNIFMKVPYQSMKDQLVKRKMETYPKWYNWTTMVSFLQGLGRGNRHKTDWCRTYLLDGSFDYFFYSYGELPKKIQSRLVKASLHQHFSGDIKTEYIKPPVAPPMPVNDELGEAKRIAAEQKPKSIFGKMFENEDDNAII